MTAQRIRQRCYAMSMNKLLPVALLVIAACGGHDAQPDAAPMVDF